MVQIIGPDGVNPMQAAAAIAQPFTQALDRYSNGGTELAQAQLQAFYQQAMMQSKIAADKAMAADRIAAERDIATQRIEAERINQAARDKTYLDRQDMRDRSMADRLALQQTQSGIAAVRKELLQNGITVPVQDEGETPEQYFSRLSDISSQHVAKKNVTMGTRLFEVKNQIESIDDEMGKLSQAGPIPDEAVQQAAIQNAAEFLKQIETMSPAKAKELSKLQAGEDNWIMADKAPQDFLVAIKNAGLISEWAQFQQAIKRDMVQQQSLSVPRENAMRYHALEKQRLQLEAESNGILMRHPASLDTYGELLRKRNEERTAVNNIGQQAQAFTPAVTTPEMVRQSDNQEAMQKFAFETQSPMVVNQSGAPVAGQPVQPIGNFSPEFTIPQRNPMSMPVYGVQPPTATGQSVVLPAINNLVPQTTTSQIAMNETGANTNVLARIMPVLSRVAKSIHAQGGGWRDFSGNLRSADPAQLGISPRDLQILVGGTDPVKLYEAALLNQSSDQDGVIKTQNGYAIAGSATPAPPAPIGVPNNVAPAQQPMSIAQVAVNKTGANPNVLSRIMPVLSHAAKAINAQGGGWRDFSGNLRSARPELLGISPRDLEILVGGTDPQALYHAALIHQPEAQENVMVTPQGYAVDPRVVNNIGF